MMDNGVRKPIAAESRPPKRRSGSGGAVMAGVVLLTLWGIGLVMVLLSPLAFPQWPSASFFSTSPALKNGPSRSRATLA